MDEEVIKKYLKENLRISIATRWSSFKKNIKIELSLGDETISSDVLEINEILEEF